MSAASSKFCKAVRSLGAALMALFLVSCSRDTRESDIKQCIAEVQREAATGALIDLEPSDSSEERHDKLGAYVAGCMSKDGYGHANFEMSDARCVDDVDFNPYCYRRTK